MKWCHPKDAEDALWAYSKESHSPAAAAPLSPLQSIPSSMTSDKSTKPQPMQESQLYFLLLPPPFQCWRSETPHLFPTNTHSLVFRRLWDRHSLFISSVLHIMMVQPKDLSLHGQAHLINPMAKLHLQSGFPGLWLYQGSSITSYPTICPSILPSVHLSILLSIHPLIHPPFLLNRIKSITEEDIHPSIYPCILPSIHSSIHSSF